MWSTLLCLFSWLSALFLIVSVCCRLVSVVVGCNCFDCFKLFQFVSHLRVVQKFFHVVQLVSSVVLDRLDCQLFRVFHLVQFVLDSCPLSGLVQVVFGCCSVAQVVLCCFSSL